MAKMLKVPVITSVFFLSHLASLKETDYSKFLQGCENGKNKQFNDNEGLVHIFTCHFSFLQ